MFLISGKFKKRKALTNPLCSDSGGFCTKPNMKKVANTLLSAHCPKGKVPQALYRGAMGTLSRSRFTAFIIVIGTRTWFDAYYPFVPGQTKFVIIRGLSP